MHNAYMMQTLLSQTVCLNYPIIIPLHLHIQGLRKPFLEGGGAEV